MIYKEKGKVTAVLAWTSTLFKSYLAIKLTNFPLGRSRQFCPEQKNLSLDIMSPNIFSTFLNRRTEGINRLLITWEKRFEEYTSSIVVMSFLKIFCMKISCIASWCTKVRHNRLTGSAELRVDLQERNISSYKSGRMFVGLRLFDRYCFVCLIGIVSFVWSVLFRLFVRLGGPWFGQLVGLLSRPFICLRGHWVVPLRPSLIQYSLLIQLEPCLLIQLQAREVWHGSHDITDIGFT